MALIEFDVLFYYSDFYLIVMGFFLNLHKQLQSFFDPLNLI